MKRAATFLARDSFNKLNMSTVSSQRYKFNPSLTLVEEELSRILFMRILSSIKDHHEIFKLAAINQDLFVKLMNPFKTKPTARE